MITDYTDYENMIDKYFGEIEECYESNPDKALGILMQTTVAINYAYFSPTSLKGPAFINRLDKWIAKLKASLLKIANVANALTYSISVGFPSGVSISVTWECNKIQGP